MSYIFAPYIPVLTQPIISDSFGFEPISKLKSRYSTKVLNSSMYGTLIITGDESNKRINRIKKLLEEIRS